MKSQRKRKLAGWTRITFRINEKTGERLSTRYLPCGSISMQLPAALVARLKQDAEPALQGWIELMEASLGL